MAKIKPNKINRLLNELGFNQTVDKPLSKFGLEIFLGNLGLGKEKVREIMERFE